MARSTGNCVELSIRPHSARSGWEVVRLNYDAHNPYHLAQIEAALAALRKSRFTSAEGPAKLVGAER
jgi:hypothetical protein